MSFVTDNAGGVTIAIKAIPGARRNEIAGQLGERIKVKVSAPPEGGRANKAICKALAKALGVRARDVTIESGHASREKTARVVGLGAQEVRARLTG